MKQIIQKFANLLLTSLLLISIAHAQAPNLFNYQAVARNASGVVIANQAIGLQFTIVNGSETGTTQYQETQTATTNSLGLFTVQIGAGTVVSGTIANVSWGSGENFLKVQIDPTGGTNYTVTGTSQLLSVPYALYAANGGGTSGSGITGQGGAGSFAAFTGSSTIGNAFLQETSQGQIWYGGQNPAIGNSDISINNGSASSAPTDALFASSNLTNGSNIYAVNNCGTSTAVLENDGSGPGLTILASNSTWGMQVTDNNAIAPNNAFAGFGSGGAIDQVVINETVNGHGQITLASDASGTQTVNINCNLDGMVTTIGDTAVTQTGLNINNIPYFSPYTNNTTALGQFNYLWSVVCSTNGVIQTSDSRSKENVQPLEYGLNTIMQLQPVSYNWKNKNLRLGTGTNLGFLAQDIEKVLPDVVVHDINSDEEIASAKKKKGVDLERDVYGVKYAEFTPVIVKAIQEQQKMINDLKAIVLQQQQQIEELKNK